MRNDPLSELRCPRCAKPARDGAAYCAICGQRLSEATSSQIRRKRSRKALPISLIMAGFVACGVFKTRHASMVAAPIMDVISPSNNVLSLSDVGAIQVDGKFTGYEHNELLVTVYNGSRWTLNSLDVEVRVRRAGQTIRQTYRLAPTYQIAPLSTETIVKTTAIHWQKDDSLDLNVVGARGIRESN
jgi:hypothetical protein